jgi:truncated hemoglobin YjbI
MAKLKAIGSEKLEGADKLKRIMEIATYRMPLTSINEKASEYSINLSDGMDYHIVKEKQGYILKKGINESTLDYMEPMKNRKYFSSYAQALRKLNLIIKENNELNGQSEELKLFGEQKKFVLKTPTPPAPEVVTPEVPAEPMALPAPELPMNDMGGDDELDLGMDTELDLDVPAEEPITGGEDMEERVSFKVIQKLTGKLTQKMRALEDQEGMSSEDIKYVINMILSALDLTKLDPEDMEDIMSKFEDVEADVEMDSDMGGETEMDLDFEDEVSMEEPMEGMGSEDYDYNSVRESNIDKVLSKYFEVTDSEVELSKKLFEERKNENKKKVNSFISKIETLSETIEQELASKKFLEENSNFEFVGRTNKKNLIFENKNKQIKISVEGIVL